MKRIGIIGAGRFGVSLAENLTRRGAEVLLMDSNKDTVQHLSALVSKVVQGNGSNKATLQKAGFQECDTAVVAIGSNMEASILATMNLKELKLSNVVAKAGSEMHGKVLERIGADQVIYPEKERAQRLARTLLARSAVDYFEISDGVSVAEMKAPSQFVGKTLIQTNIRSKHEITILAIKRGTNAAGTQEKIISPAGDTIIMEGDTLVFFGPDKNLEAIS